jgi:tetratricopeptide (TPR) repeat protein
MEFLLGSGRLPAATLPPLVLQLGNLYMTLGNYPKAIGLFTRSLKDSGEDRAVRIKLIQAIYLSKDYTRAATELHTLVAADELISKKPELDTLKLWGSAVTLLNDKVAYIDVLEKFVAYYPSKEYWADLINRLASRPGFPERLLIEIYRLQFATGTMTSALDYTELAQLAASAGFPSEAKKAMEAGYAAGVLGKGAAKDVAAQQKLRDQVTKSAADDLRSLSQGEANADKPGKDGTGLTNLGFAMVQIGQSDKGLELMERGIAKGLGKRSEDGKLHLGIAQAMAGRKDVAVKTLATVGGTDGTAELARYWIMQINSSK